MESFLQAQTVTGKVTSSVDGLPLPKRQCAHQNTFDGVTTEVDGSYELAVGKGATLVFSFIGFESKEIIVTNQTVVDVVLEQASELLKDVVVVAYGTVKKSDLTGSVSSVSSDDLNRTAPTSLDQALQGRAAGVQVTQVSGDPAAKPPSAYGAAAPSTRATSRSTWWMGCSSPATTGRPMLAALLAATSTAFPRLAPPTSSESRF
ncbi:MAG: carboxypeptidase-like regulatory domain-containing protein [Saprospiraceae bacterium]|nr:carboxypeptidase-like regulatory domain-containing protein [Saprospiraceae bacterium]